MTGRSYRVHVTTEDVDRVAWLNQVDRANAETIRDAFVQHIEATGETLLHVRHGWFDWICPGCGSAPGGRLAEQPVPGWDSPAWVMSGPRDRPTLTPSLGCPRWPQGKCSGHWWLRNGLLEPA
jgi:hypothetical protein